MLSHEDNKFVSQVGPGTPMGNLFRLFWLPALMPDKLSEPDGPPVRLRILGEDLVAFRDSTGKSASFRSTVPIGAPRSSSDATRKKDCDASITAGSSMPRAHAWTCPMSRRRATSSTRYA
jgi:hypothetical protein